MRARGSVRLAAQRSLLRAARETMEALLHTGGLDDRVAAWRRRGGAAVLMYHSVTNRQNELFIDPAVQVPVELFERQMRLLARRRVVISMEELVATLTDGRTPRAGSVVITFDDGYLDTLQVAAPVLDSLGLPAMLYLPTAAMDTGESQWIDSLWNLFRTRRREDVRTSLGAWRLDRPGAEADAHRQARLALMSATAPRRALILGELQEGLGSDPDELPRLTMQWGDVRALLDTYKGFAFGGHTRTHVDLTSLSPADAGQEAAACRADIRAHTGVTTDHFSYPYSRWNTAARHAVAAAGFRSAVVAADPYLARAGVDLLLLPRVDARVAPARLGYLTSGASDRLSWRRGT